MICLFFCHLRKSGKKGQKGVWTRKGDGDGRGEKGKGGKGEKGGKGKGKGKKGWRKEEWFPQEEGRSQLSSEAADFIPSGLYDYDILSHQYWDMEDDTWREFADHEGTKYYYNCKTGLTQWERPAELDLPKAARSSPLTSAKKAPAPASATPAPSRKGPKGEGKTRTGNPKKKDRSKEKDETSFGPPGCNLFVFHLPDEWGDDDMVEQLAESKYHQYVTFFLFVFRHSKGIAFPHHQKKQPKRAVFRLGV